MKELTDLEICKKIAKIEGVDYSVHTSAVGLAYTDELGEVLWYNPLKNDALCFRLMVKHEVSIDFDCVRDVNISGFGFYGFDSSPNKAICLAIIKANN